MQNRVVTVGKIDIEVSDSHIYLSGNLRPTYDYVPWNVVGHLMKCASLSNPILIDIGANVGDSAAHFRRHSDSTIVCVEPSSYFFDILERNSANLGDVRLVNKILVPEALVGQVAYSAGGQTGSTSLLTSESESDAWKGHHTTFAELLNNQSSCYIVKSDTDGFDAELMLALLATVAYNGSNVPIAFFEGPTSKQIDSGDFERWTVVFNEFHRLGYGLLFLTNIGMPYIYSHADASAAVSALNSLCIGYRHGGALCHYFDVIAFSHSIESPEARLEKAWGDEFFRRS